MSKAKLWQKILAGTLGVFGVSLFLLGMPGALPSFWWSAGSAVAGIELIVLAMTLAIHWRDRSDT
ncbi:MAG TPA: hypothetical protein VHM90_16635 [Phycisphaerae bacterium]|nr:hypothetical protein [Phycisphaerae bacterium]